MHPVSSSNPAKSIAGGVEAAAGGEQGVSVTCSSPDVVRTGAPQKPHNMALRPYSLAYRPRLGWRPPLAVGQVIPGPEGPASAWGIAGDRRSRER